MIYDVRNKVDGSPEANYTVAVCDRCKLQCKASRQPGRHNIEASEAAEAAAVADGWVERNVSEFRRSGWTVQLLCPKCAETPAPTYEEMAAAYCCVHPVNRHGGKTRHCSKKRGHGPGGEYCRVHASTLAVVDAPR